MQKKIVCFAALVVSDLAVVLLGFRLAWALLPGLPAAWSEFRPHLPVLTVYLVVFAAEKLYTKRRGFPEEARVLLRGATVSAAFFTLGLTFTWDGAAGARVAILLAWAFSLVLLPLSRALVKTALFHLGLWRKRVVVIGTSETTASVVRSLGRKRILGYQIVGGLTEDPKLMGASIEGIPILGHYDDIEMWRKRAGFEDIIVADPDIPSGRLIDLIRRWDDVAETIRYIPGTGELITSGIEIENIGRIMSLTIRKNLLKPWNILIKAGFDFVLSVVFLVLIAPVCLLIALAVKIDSPGPAFFTQIRYGRRGRLIRIFKFRSMHVDADRRLEAYLRDHPEAREELSRFKKIRGGDPRVTRVGAFIRRFSLDELPQIFNVVTGRMSLVGPRPYLQEELAEVKLMKSVLFQARPGITGLWQISGRSDVSFADRIKKDEQYIRNWTLLTDLGILLRTVGVALSGRGAY